MKGARFIVGAVVALVAAPASAAQRPIPLDVVVRWMLLLDGAPTHAARPVMTQWAAGPLDERSSLATASLSSTLVDFDRLAPVAPPMLMLSEASAYDSRPIPFAVRGNESGGQAIRGAVLALNATGDAGRPPRRRASALDVMVFLTITGQGAMPQVGVRGGMAAIAWRAAMMGTGRMPLRQTPSH